ncbi:MAG: Rne/Rng family ribonuclease [Beijerinckiaceae bacterium]|nr:Rne/Rng family ribonuclease [Beijerinckiaceae bacterium]
MSNKMLIDASHPEETRVVVLRGNRIDEFDFESASKKPLRGNIYLAKVTRVEPSLQAAFVEYGGNRHGFLAFSEIHPDYYQIPVADRQALLEDEQRQHSEDEDEEPRQRKGRKRRSRNGRERRSRNGDSVSGDAPALSTDSGDGVASAADDVKPEEFTTNSSDINEMTSAPASEQSGDEQSVPNVETEASQGDAPEAVVVAEQAPHQPVVDETPQEEVVEVQAAISDEAPAPSEPVDARAVSSDDAAQAEHDNDDDTPRKTDKSDDDEDSEDSSDDEDEDDEEDDEDDDEDSEEESEDDHVEQIGGDDVEEMPVRATRSRRQYKIQEVIRRRQVLLVQVVKEERGNKGAALTTYLSLAGRYSVLMPNTARGGGISRKITDGEDRRRMKEIAQALDVPEGMGVILRTAGASRSKQEVRRDFEHLLRMWESVRELTLQSTAPTLVYEEGSLIKRTVRDLYSEEIDDIVVAGDQGFKEARDYMRMLMPTHARKIQHWREDQPLFARMGVEAQLDAMFSAQVTLKSGGYIVINQTEALVAIDVNSGRSTREHNIEDTALRTNLEASDEVARQLRLRDLAGLIVVDYIDMEENKNNRAVERRLKEALKNDRARIQVGRISHFGLLEMSRQRMRTGVLEGSSIVCPHCSGAGTVRSTASLSLHILRVIEDTLVRNAQYNLNVRTRSVVALYMLNQKRAHLREIEERFGVTLVISADDTLQGSVYHVLERGDLASPPAAPPRLGLIQVDSLALPEIEEEEIEPEIELESEVESEADADEDEDGEEDRAGDTQGDNGRKRKRRRRRRGREREPSGIDADAPQPSDDSLAALVPIDGSFPIASATVGDGEVDEFEAEQEGDATLAEANVEGERNGRRKRRSRRGGRRGERPEQEEQAAEPGGRSALGSWVRTADSSDPEFDARPEAADLTSTAPMESPAAPEAPVATGFASEQSSELASNADQATAPSQPVTEELTPPVAPPEPAPEAVAAPTYAPPAPEPELAQVEPSPVETARIEPVKVEPVKVEPLPEAPAPSEKKGGWWQRAKSQLTGG